MRLQAFLYVLLRDHLAFGDVVRIAEEAEKMSMNSGGPAFNEVQMAGFAEALARRLRDRSTW
jgi:hypothetical protein